MVAVILGLDGFHVNLLKYCPNVKEIYENSISGILKSVIPPLTLPAWATIHTGADIGSHRAYGFLKFDYKSDKTRVFRQNDIKHAFFYEYLYNAGYKLFLMNIPLTEPPRIPGDVIQSWFTRSDKLEDYLVPKDLIDRYPSIKRYKIFPKYLKNFDEVLKIVKSQEKVIKEVVKSENHDIIFAFISATDWIQHQALPEILDGKHKKGLEILREVDELVGWISNHVETFILFSDHGFKIYDEIFFLNNWLKKEKYLAVNSKGKTIVGREIVYNRSINVKNLAYIFYKNRFLYRIGSALKPFIENLFTINLIYEDNIDIEKSIAFTIEQTSPSIFINRNIPLENRRAIIREIVEKLNKKGIKAKSSEELYGIFDDNFPDIFIIDEDIHIVKGAGGKKIMDKFNRGFHSRNGIFIIKTRDIKQEKIYMELKDLAPTILDLFRVGIPEDMEGKSIFGGNKKIKPLYSEKQRTSEKIRSIKKRCKV